MVTVNAYERYFAAECTANGVERHAALVALKAASESGRIVYEASVTFFPHNSEEDFAVSYDAHYSGIDRLAEDAGGKVFWAKPLRESRFG